MPTKNTGNADTELNSLLGGRSEDGRFLSRVNQIEKMRAVIEKMNAEQSKFAASVAKSTESAMKSIKRENILLKSKGNVYKALDKSQRKQIASITKYARLHEKQLQKETRLTQKQLRIESQLHRTREKLSRTRSSGGSSGFFGGGGASLGLASIVGGSAIAYAAIKRIQEIAEKRVDAYLNLGGSASRSIAGMGSKGISTASKLGLLSDFQGAGVGEFLLGRNEDIQKGLLSAQAELAKNVGASTANELVAELSKSFGADLARRRGFFSAVGSRGLLSALGAFQSQEGFVQFERARNALAARGETLLTPMIQ